MNPPSIYKTPEGKRKIQAEYEAFLSHWPVPYQTNIIKTRHGETFLIQSGPETAPPLFLIHGACSNSSMWAGEISTLSKNFCVYAIDIPGEPGRSAEKRLAWENNDFSDWMKDIVNELGYSSINLVGISLGGWISLKFTTVHPQHVDKLVLLAPGGISPVKTSFMLRGILLSFLGRWGATKVNQITFGSQQIHPEAVRYMDIIMTKFKPRISVQPIFSNADLQKLSMPVLLILGQMDALMPSKRIAARLKSQVSHCEVKFFPDLGPVLIGTGSTILSFLNPD